MEKYRDLTSVLDKFNEEMSAFNEQGQELSAINNALRAFKPEDIYKAIRVNKRCVAKSINDHMYSDVVSKEEISNDANELNDAMQVVSSKISDVNEIKSSLISREYNFDKNQEIVDEFVEIFNNAIDELESVQNKSKDLLDNNYDKYINDDEVVDIKVEDNKEEEKQEVKEEVKEENIVPFDRPIISDFDVEKVEDVEEISKDNEYAAFDEKALDEINNSVESALENTQVEDTFNPQEIVTDSIEEEKEESKEEDKTQDNIDNLVDLLNNGIDFDSELNDLEKDKKELEETKEELNNFDQVLQEDKEVSLENVVNDYSNIPEGFEKVVNVEEFLNDDKEVQEEHKLSRSA